MAKAEQTRETNHKFALWIRESSLDMAKQLYKEDNCASQSEFIEKAILFYAGYLLSGKSNRYLPNIITSTLKGIVDESDNRMSRMLFKLAVELAITMNLIAAAQDIDRVTLERLRGECVKEVKRIGLEALNLPKHLVEKTPADGLCGKTDEDNLGFTYQTEDDYLRRGIVPEPAIKERIDQLHKQSAFKREVIRIPVFDPQIPFITG